MTVSRNIQIKRGTWVGVSCSVDGCSGKVKTNHLCIKHYMRMHRYGSVDAVQIRQRGTGNINPQGYLGYRIQGRGMVFEHVLNAEKALGKELPKGSVVHHVNSIQDNKSLVVCPDQAYHLLIHQRQRAWEACGNASWRKCSNCKEYDDPSNMKIVQTSQKNTTTAYHPVRNGVCVNVNS